MYVSLLTFFLVSIQHCYYCSPNCVYKLSCATDNIVISVQLMNLLFSFLKPDHPHGTLSAGYFAKVLSCIYLLLEEKSQMG